MYKKTFSVITLLMFVVGIFLVSGLLAKAATRGDYEEEPVYEEPVVEDDYYTRDEYVEEPVYEEPVVEDDYYTRDEYVEEPVYEEPVVEDDYYTRDEYAEEPAYEEPVYDDYSYQEPVREDYAENDIVTEDDYYTRDDYSYDEPIIEDEYFPRDDYYIPEEEWGDADTYSREDYNVEDYSQDDIYTREDYLVDEVDYPFEEGDIAGMRSSMDAMFTEYEKSMRENGTWTEESAAEAQASMNEFNRAWTEYESYYASYLRGDINEDENNYVDEWMTEEDWAVSDLEQVDEERLYSENEEDLAYEREVLSRMEDAGEECGEEDLMYCLSAAYGLEEDVVTEEEITDEENVEVEIEIDVEVDIKVEKPTLTEKEIGDAVVFKKKKGEVITVPKIVNLQGSTVGGTPAVLVVSKPKDSLTINVFVDGKKVKSTKPVATIKGEADEEGKSVLAFSKNLPPGKYVAEIVSDTAGAKVSGKEITFTVDAKVDKDLYISDLAVKEDNVHEPYVGEVKGTVTYLFGVLENVNPSFKTDDYVEYARTGGKALFVTGKVSASDKTNKMVYLTYQSVALGSVVIADAGQQGVFKKMVPKELGLDDKHKLTAYIYEPKKDQVSSLKDLFFSNIK